MGRKTKEELKEITKKYNVNRLWSWSKFNTYHNSPYEYYLKYIIKKPEDRQDCIYTTTGGMAHDIMESLYTGKIEYENMDSDFEDAWITANIAELKFDRNDSGKNKKISDKYYKNLKHFFNHHIMIPHKMQIEQFITALVGENVFQGYIDACYKDKDGNYNILDWKTSSIYKGEKALNECGQLVVYAIGLHQMGVPFEKIKICWDFLKYVKVDCKQANGKWTTREIERCEIGSKLQSSAKMWLKKCGYEDKLIEYLDMLAQTNDINCLPQDVQANFVFHDCIVYVDLTQDLIDRWTADIINTIDKIENMENKYYESHDEMIFYDSPEQVAKQSYYFSTLCAYSPKLHKPYKLYLDKLESKKNGGSFFDGLGTDVKREKLSTENNTVEKEDLSWLEQL